MSFVRPLPPLPPAVPIDARHLRRELPGRAPEVVLIAATGVPPWTEPEPTTGLDGPDALPRWWPRTVPGGGAGQPAADLDEEVAERRAVLTEADALFAVLDGSDVTPALEALFAWGAGTYVVVVWQGAGPVPAWVDVHAHRVVRTVRDGVRAIDAYADGVATLRAIEAVDREVGDEAGAVAWDSARSGERLGLRFEQEALDDWLALTCPAGRRYCGKREPGVPEWAICSMEEVGFDGVSRPCGWAADVVVRAGWFDDGVMDGGDTARAACARHVAAVSAELQHLPNARLAPVTLRGTTGDGR